METVVSSNKADVVVRTTKINFFSIRFASNAFEFVSMCRLFWNEPMPGLFSGRAYMTSVIPLYEIAKKPGMTLSAKRSCYGALLTTFC